MTRSLKGKLYHDKKFIVFVTNRGGLHCSVETRGIWTSSEVLRVTEMYYIWLKSPKAMSIGHLTFEIWWDMSKLTVSIFLYYHCVCQRLEVTQLIVLFWVLKCLCCLVFVSRRTILSSYALSRNVGFLSLSSSELTTFVLSRVVILSLTVGNMREMSGDLPVVAVWQLKLTKRGRISPLGEYAGFDLKHCLHTPEND